MSMTKDGRKIEQMNRTECVDTFKQLQGWYNSLKTATTDLEIKHDMLQGEYDRALETIELLVNKQVELELRLQEQITESNLEEQNHREIIQKMNGKYREIMAGHRNCPETQRLG